MGAAEWTGYSTTPATSTTSAYPTYGAASSYGYDAVNSVDHHSTNFQLPTVLPEPPYCPTDYHPAAVQPTVNSIVCPNNYTKSTDLVDPLTSSYPPYNNWNGYNTNYQYSGCATQTQYPPHTGPTMVSWKISKLLYSFFFSFQIKLF